MTNSWKYVNHDVIYENKDVNRSGFFLLSHHHLRRRVWKDNYLAEFLRFIYHFGQLPFWSSTLGLFSTIFSLVAYITCHNVNLNVNLISTYKGTRYNSWIIIKLNIQGKIFHGLQYLFLLYIFYHLYFYLYFYLYYYLRWDKVKTIKKCELYKDSLKNKILSAFFTTSFLVESIFPNI